MKIAKFMVMILYTFVHANEIQIFTANTMKIKLDTKTKIKERYCGSLDGFYKNSKKIFAVPTVEGSVKNAVSGAVHAVHFSSATRTSYDPRYILLGAAADLVGYGIKNATDYITGDHEYTYVSQALNTKGETTMLETLIVANYELTNDEIKKIGINAQQKLIKSGEKK